MESTTQSMALPIFGLSCGGGGALAAERVLEKLTGVVRAYVNPLTEMAYIEFEPALVGEAQVIAVLSRVGLGVGRASLRR